MIIPMPFKTPPWLAALLISSTNTWAATQTLFIGTYTGPKSEGIHAVSFNDETGEFSDLKLAARYINPNFLALHPQLPVLYCVGENPEKKGSVAAFSINADQTLTLLGDVDSVGRGPCHIAIDPTGKIAAVANYGSGSTISLQLDAQGKLSEVISLIQHEGKSVHPKRQTGPHAHGVYFADQTLFVPDLGIDAYVAFRYDTARRSIERLADGGGVSRPGDGPRHMVFTTDGSRAYGINELSSSVTFYLQKNGKLTPVQHINSLPEGTSADSCTAAEIAIHPSGKFLLSSNRGYDSLACYAIDPVNGTLHLVGITPLAVKTPRHFTISGNGRFVLAAGQGSDAIEVLRFDAATGKLTSTDTRLQVGSPVCLIWKTAH